MPPLSAYRTFLGHRPRSASAGLPAVPVEDVASESTPEPAAQPSGGDVTESTAAE